MLINISSRNSGKLLLLMMNGNDITIISMMLQSSSQRPATQRPPPHSFTDVSFSKALHPKLPLNMQHVVCPALSATECRDMEDLIHALLDLKV